MALSDERILELAGLAPNRRVCASTCVTRKIDKKPCQCYPGMRNDEALALARAIEAEVRKDDEALIARLLDHIERSTCTHEETHRGGVIWEICDGCGAKWADDEGGKPPFAWPKVVLAARDQMKREALETPAELLPDLLTALSTVRITRADLFQPTTTDRKECNP